MAMEDVLPSIIVIVMVYLLVRWVTKPRTDGDPTPIRGVTRQMVDTVSNAFPDIPPANIVYSLSRTRSTQATSEEILERSFLPPPPASFTIPPSLLPPPTPAHPATTVKHAIATKTTSLIERYDLTSRILSRKGKEKIEVEGEGDSAVSSYTTITPGGTGMGISGGGAGTGEWGETKEKREKDLRERKQRMVLEARRRLMEKQEKEAATV